MMDMLDDYFRQILDRFEDRVDRPMHSGFDCPAYGTILPDDVVVKYNEDGKLTFISPEKEQQE